MINLRDVVETTFRHVSHREKYRDGVVEEAVKRASGLTDEEDIIGAIELAFLANRISINPNWDGSIG